MGEGDFSLWRGLNMWGYQAPVLHWGLLYRVPGTSVLGCVSCLGWLLWSQCHSHRRPQVASEQHTWRRGWSSRWYWTVVPTLLLWEITCWGFEGARKMAQDGSRDTETRWFFENVSPFVSTDEKSEKAGMFKNIIFYSPYFSLVLPSEVKNLCRRSGFNSRVRKIPWRREWQPTPVFLPRESHGQRSHGVAKSCIWLRDFHFQENIYYLFFWLQISICLQRKFGQYLDFPGDPVAKTLHFQCKGQGFNPW